MFTRPVLCSRLGVLAAHFSIFWQPILAAHFLGWQLVIFGCQLIFGADSSFFVLTARFCPSVLGCQPKFWASGSTGKLFASVASKTFYYGKLSGCGPAWPRGVPLREALVPHALRLHLELLRGCGITPGTRRTPARAPRRSSATPSAGCWTSWSPAWPRRRSTTGSFGSSSPLGLKDAPPREALLPQALRLRLHQTAPTMQGSLRRRGARRRR